MIGGHGTKCVSTLKMQLRPKGMRHEPAEVFFGCHYLVSKHAKTARF